MTKILIVDDDPLTISIYSEKLRAENFEISAAKNGQDAWSLIQSGQVPDVIFTGIIMPGMSGFELIEKIQADPRFAGIPVAIFSHRNRPEDREKAKKLGVDDFIAQYLTTPIEVVRRLKLLAGRREAFKVKIDPKSYDAPSFLASIDKLQETNCADCEGNIILEFHPQPDQQVYKIYLKCPDCEKK